MMLRYVALLSVLVFFMPRYSLAQETTLSPNHAEVAVATGAQTDDAIPLGTRITMQNWQNFKQFMPDGMVALFEGKYFWKMPADVSMEVGPTVNYPLPKNYLEATEKYSSPVKIVELPDGGLTLTGYQGGIPFPNPEEPHKGWKVLANVNWPAGPQMYVNTPTNYGTVWSMDRFGNVNASTFDVVYQVSTSDYISDPGIPTESLDYAPGTWYTEWAMEESPEQARYTASLELFYIDQEKQPFPDTFVFVPALRRSLRLSSTAPALRSSGSTGATTTPRPMASTGALRFTTGISWPIARS